MQNYIGKVKNESSKDSIFYLVWFRIFFGICSVIELLAQMFTTDLNIYAYQGFHFNYQWFINVPLFSTYTVLVLFILGLASSIFFSAGYFYKIVSKVQFLVWLLLFQIDQSEYVNHSYLYVLISFVSCFFPANKSFSLDVYFKRVAVVTQVPKLYRNVLLFQMGIVYFYAGIAKVNLDWFQAMPLQIWLGYKSEYFMIGPIISHKAWAFVMSYVGVTFDLTITFFLLFRPTRRVAFLMCLLFHLSNVMIFGLASFPWFSICMSSLFLSLEDLKPLTKFLRISDKAEFSRVNLSFTLNSFFVFFIIIQLVLPLRPFLYNGNSMWTEEGHRFSWHMMLRSKQGYLNYKVVTYKDGKRKTIFVAPKDYLLQEQARKMKGRPEMIIGFAHYLEEFYLDYGYETVEVFANCKMSLNGHESRWLIDREVNLASEERGVQPYQWILPFDQRLEKQKDSSKPIVSN
ncbi:HTTM domain-containing protein [Sediminitomix flava]|uniref:Vitamin K-dependent gamma-carboxylase-like protein n=1 Tax=Sediminitomix flava TaxID=379075 RepID=A0A315ZFY2_SEDFL|nr:HTTM domain-containing protein [Sediminitomix flava]PWJ44063.1 vitamin K-dependent gamma-carboxylase-like protein [Sediminitomix flava]